ncbi:hypothetical protein PCE1_000410 [Barthelona sp. PCE]
MSRNASRARKIADIAREAPNYASKCTFKHVHILLSPSDGGAWKVTLHSSTGGTFIDTQLNNDVSSLINGTNPEKVLMSCGDTYGAIGIVNNSNRDGVCETHFVTFTYNDDGIEILNRVVVPEVCTHMCVYDRNLGIIGANQNVITTYLVLNDGSLVNRTEHHLPFPIISFFLCPHNWVIATKHLHLNESIIGLYNIDSGEHTTLPHIVTELDISISASNSYSFDACNMAMRDEIVFVTLSFPNKEMYTMSTANANQKYETTDELRMNSISSEDYQTLTVADIIEPSAPSFGGSVSVCVDLEPKPKKQKQPEKSLPSIAATMHAAANRKMGEGDGKVLTRDGSFELMSNDGKLILVNDVTGESFSTVEVYEPDAAYLMRVNEHYMVICANVPNFEVIGYSTLYLYGISKNGCFKIGKRFFGNKVISAKFSHKNSIFLEFPLNKIHANITMQGLTNLEYSHKPIEDCEKCTLYSFL